MPLGAVLDLHMPDWVQLEIASCVILFGRLEQKIIEIAWDMAGSNEVRERLKRAKQSSHDNLDEILGVIETAATFEAIRTAFKGAKTETLSRMGRGSWQADGRMWFGISSLLMRKE
jgi:hypothetical protein